jgi:hypothetical protein
MPKDRLEKLRTNAFFELLGEASDLSPKVMRDKFKKVGLKNYRDYLAAVEKLIRVVLREGLSLDVAKTQASIMILAQVMDWEPKALARRLIALNIKGLDDVSSSVLGQGMEAYQKKYGDESINALRPTALRTWQALLMDMWPDSPAAIADFWLTDQEHYEALYFPVRRGEITPEDLDQVLGDPEAITELVNNMPSNPHKGIVFGESPAAGPSNGWEPTRN